MQLNIARQTRYHFDGAGFSGERLVNWYFEPGEGLSGGKLIGRSGFTQLVRLDQGGQTRAILYSTADDLLYAVCGGRLWTVASDGTATVKASGIPDGDTRIASNGDQVGIVAGGRYFLWDGASLREPSMGNLLSVNDIAFLDGYFILTGVNSARKDSFTITDLYNGRTINALDIATAEASPDEIRGVLVDHSEVWLFGATTVELWYNNGAADFPFARTAGGIIEHGAKAYTWAKEDNGVFWVDDDCAVYRASGVQPTVISTREIETRLCSGTITNAFVMVDKGHKFYVIRLSDGPALAYDMTTGLWTEFASSADLNPIRALCTVRAWEGRWYIGTSNGGVFFIDRASFTDGGVEIARIAQNPPLDRQNNWFPVRSAELRGLSGKTDIGRDARVCLETSRDGYVWSRERWRSFGRVGNYGQSVTWNGLGSFQQFHTRITVTDPVPFDVWGVTIE